MPIEQIIDGRRIAGLGAVEQTARLLRIGPHEGMVQIESEVSQCSNCGATVDRLSDWRTRRTGKHWRRRVPTEPPGSGTCATDVCAKRCIHPKRGHTAWRFRRTANSSRSATAGTMVSCRFGNSIRCGESRVGLRTIVSRVALHLDLTVTGSFPVVT